jgi:sec-independent protein translocase protein TatA
VSHLANRRSKNEMPIRLGPFELIIVLVIVVIIFGVGRLPEIGGAVGKAIREFREATTTPEEEDKTSDDASKE